MATDITLTIGETWEIDVPCKDGNGNLINVATAEWRLANGTGLVLKATIGNGIIQANTSQLQVLIPPTTQTTVNATPGLCNHELFVVDTGGFDSIQFSGKARLLNSLKNKYP